MLTHCRCLLGLVVAVSMASTRAAVAFEDNEFCVAARQVALAANGDVGNWIDRKTRTAGIDVFCDTKRVVFKQFTYTPSASLDEGWKARKGEEWNSSRCGNPIWADAVRNKWQVVLSVNSADGKQVTLNAQCK